MGYVLLGHGGLELADGGFPEGMGVVAIDAGSTLQVYSDTGQAMGAGPDNIQVFSKLQAPWPPMDSTNVTYNLELSSAEDIYTQWEKVAPGLLDQAFAPHTVLRAGRDLTSPITLCTGTPQTCPTDPRMVSGAVPGPRAHVCEGILGKYKGELLWVACTVVYTESDEINDVGDAARGDAPNAVVVGVDPDDAIANWYAMQQSADEPTLEGWFDDQSEQVRQAMLVDPHIADWNNNR